VVAVVADGARWHDGWGSGMVAVADRWSQSLPPPLRTILIIFQVIFRPDQ